MKYKATKNIVGGPDIAKSTENLTVDQLGGEDSVERLLRLGAIEEMPAGKKAKAAENEAAAAEKEAAPAADKKEK